MDKKRKRIVIGFGIFLSFMALCTIIAKGIYTSGLPIVSVINPTSNSLVHEINVSGKVKEGQEYGVYVDSGLRVATIQIRKGESFSSGDPLFQIDTDDLRNIIETYEFEIKKLNAQKKEYSQATVYEKQNTQQEIARAAQDYELAEKEYDVEILKRQVELQDAKDALKLYEGYLANSADSVSQGDSAQIYNRQDKLEQLMNSVTQCEVSLQEALLAKEAGMIIASREKEDAEGTGDSGLTAAQENIDLEIGKQQKKVLRLQMLLDANGWVYASRSGKVTDVAISVGNRTQDMASILYALDEGKKIVETTFTSEQVKHLTLGCVFQIKVKLMDGSSVTEDIVLSYLEKKLNDENYGEMFFENDNVALGQTAELSYKKRTDIYAMCIRKDLIHQSGVTGNCVYVVEEYEGILGTEWRVRSVPVTIVDETDNMAAIESADIMSSTKIVASTTKELKDGDVVRVLE